MKLITSVVALLVLALLATPAAARHAQQDELVPVTFEFTVSGSVPEGESFGVEIVPLGGGDATVLMFCGSSAGAACTAGTPYTQTASFAAGTEIQYNFFRGQSASPNFELIREGTETLDSAKVINAAYEFGTAPGDAVTLSFAIQVTGAPCQNATYFAVLGVPQSEFFGVQLADPDGDGIYTGSTQWGMNSPIAVSLVQGTGTIQPPTSTNPFPGPPTATIRDFGLVTPADDMTFEGSVAGCPSRLPDTGAASGQLGASIIAGLLLLAAGVYLRRRAWQRA